MKTKKFPGKITVSLAIPGLLVLAIFFFSVDLVLSFRWVPPPTSAFMMQRRVQNFFKQNKDTIRYRWVNRESISPLMPLAVVAAEDQKFPVHRGFDFESISDAVEDSRRGGRLRGASTITQQTAKNLFLWPGKNFVRKGLEAYFTVLLEWLWPKRRILEVYLNIAEFSDGVYGVAAASESHLGKRPAELTGYDAALFAAVLPNPKRMFIARPSPYVQTRVLWIEQQMKQLGGIGYLENL
ncbi:monofunctional biosynthetic peptidoglycan transglycosylase [candidate division KSB1 bacterium]|nr:monofunctional biosynthetic peptidoglycan transglycosylase [candidate division KSB1 bacterium]